MTGEITQQMLDEAQGNNVTDLVFHRIAEISVY